MEECKVVYHHCIHMEAKFVACLEATIHGSWMRNFISGLEIINNIVRPLKFIVITFAQISSLRMTNILRVLHMWI